eukprot:1184200-Prorocentrum_minimum.AAC.3
MNWKIRAWVPRGPQPLSVGRPTDHRCHARVGSISPARADQLGERTGNIPAGRTYRPDEVAPRLGDAAHEAVPECAACRPRPARPRPPLRRLVLELRRKVRLLHLRADNTDSYCQESSGRKWGAEHRVRKGEGERWVLRAPLPLSAQEDPYTGGLI